MFVGAFFAKQIYNVRTWPSVGRRRETRNSSTLDLMEYSSSSSLGDVRGRVLSFPVAAIQIYKLRSRRGLYRRRAGVSALIGCDNDILCSRLNGSLFPGMADVARFSINMTEVRKRRAAAIELLTRSRLSKLVEKLIFAFGIASSCR